MIFAPFLLPATPRAHDVTVGLHTQRSTDALLERSDTFARGVTNTPPTVPAPAGRDAKVHA